MQLRRSKLLCTLKRRSEQMFDSNANQSFLGRYRLIYSFKILIVAQATIAAVSVRKRLDPKLISLNP